MMRVVFQFTPDDCVHTVVRRMGCVNNVGWAAMVLRMLRQLGLGTLADKVVQAVKTAMDSGDTDLRLPTWDMVMRLLGELLGRRTGKM
jgi:hypothetical protein